MAITSASWAAVSGAARYLNFTPSCISASTPLILSGHTSSKLGTEAKTDMFGKTPYYALNQMTKMGVRTGPDCRSDIPRLLAAGLAQAGCANHFAGFHIGLCIGNGWVAGRSAVEDLDRFAEPALAADQVEAMYDEAVRPLNPTASAESDQILRDLQAVMFAYDIGILKRADRLEAACRKV